MKERLRMEREFELLELPQPEFDTGTATPVMQLDRIEILGAKTPIVSRPSGVRKAYICSSGVLAGGMRDFSVKGWVLIEQNGIRRAFKAADKRAFPNLIVTGSAYTGGGVSNVGVNDAGIKAEGAFSSGIHASVANARRVRFQLYPEWKGGKGAIQEVVLEYNQLECFLSLIEPYEKVKPVTQTNLAFLASVRKMFQPPPGSSLATFFDDLLARNSKVPVLKDRSSSLSKAIRSLFPNPSDDNLDIDGVPVDIGHVLTGIEGSRRQNPGLGGGSLEAQSLDKTEAIITWAGDLGSVLAHVAEKTPESGAMSKAEILRLLDGKASLADLTGDIDGINIGAVYDEARSLGENLRAYYETVPFRRFKRFAANARGPAGQPILRLKPGTPPKIDPASRPGIALYLKLFAHSFLWASTKYLRYSGPQQELAFKTAREGSKESDICVDYFVEFLNKGLAGEP